MSITAVIADDEQQAREGLVTLLAKDPDIEIVSTCRNGVEAITSIRQLRPQLLFLDIQMPEVNGFEVLASINPQIMPVVIFATAYDQYALKAFEVHALDYLLKPFNDARFYLALQRAKEHLRANNPTTVARLGKLVRQFTADSVSKNSQIILGENSAGVANRLIVKEGGKIHFLNTEHIIYAEAQDYYVRIIMEKKSFLIRESLKTILQRVSPQHFIRIHRSTIVNLQKVRELSPGTNGDYMVKMNDHLELRGSRNYREIFDLL